MDLKKISEVQTRLYLSILDSRNIELNDLPDDKQLIYLSSVLIDLTGRLYGMFTITYNEDLDIAIGLAQSEIRKSIVENYLLMKKNTK